jgi:hypothetical protein
MTLTYYDFWTQLKKSESPRQYVRYLTAIDHWWGEQIDDWTRVQDLLEQKNGNDMTITLSSGKTVNLQLKSREKDYGDILIEYRHDYPSGYTKPGWIERPSDADYLIYCTPKAIYRIHYPQLHAFWHWNKEGLLRELPTKRATNRDYVTLNVAIPFPLLRQGGVQVESVSVTSKFL